jgi:hypothetical protein
MVRDQARSKVYGSRHLSSSNLRTPTGRQSVDLSKISKGGQVFAGASLVYVIASFLPWYTADVPAELAGFGLSDYSTSAWGDLGFLWGAIWALLLLVGAVLLVLPAFGVTAPKLPTVAYLAVAALAALFTLLKLLIGEDDPIETGFGLYLAALAVIGVAFGAFLMFKESGGDIGDLTDMNKLKGQFGGGAPGGGTPPPPPPPPGMTPPPPPPPPMG